MIDQTGAAWRKSRRSGNGGDCVEVATNLCDSRGVVLVRDSKNVSGPVLSFTHSEWAAFLGGIKDSKFDMQ